MAKRAGTTAENPRTAGVKDPLAAIPLAPPNVEHKRDERGRVHLRLTAPLTGLRKRIARWLRYDYSRRIELDELGGRYYELVDGRRTLHAIVDGLEATAGRGRQELEAHVVLFTRTLMRKGMLVLQVTDDNRVERRKR